MDFGLQFFRLILFLLLVRSLRADSDPCESVNCGNGACKPTSTWIGYDCECNPGWKKIQFGFLTLPPCIIPNCSVNIDCGASAPAPPPHPPLPPFNLSNPCSLFWCGDGTCVADGSNFTCNCDPNAANLFNMTGMPCFNQCAFGADCEGLGLGFGAGSPWSLLGPPNPNLNKTPPPPVASDSNSNGSIQVLRSWGIQFALTELSLFALLLCWL